MINIIGVNFRSRYKVVEFLYKLNNLDVNDHVIVKTKKGLEFGRVISKRIDENNDFNEFNGLIIKKAENYDFEIYNEIKKIEQKSISIIKKSVEKYDLNMKIIDVEYTFDKRKCIIYFSSDDRIDFRELLKEFISIFKIWVEFKQINVRESARFFGGIGVCGKIFCCCTFLKEFQKIDLHLVQEQGIITHSSKLCGGCGRLFCCLRYEHKESTDSL